ncbi:MAG TPA: hypothetical protein VNW52_08155 [Burkholderiaceae bacterium]|nr:hypothetical protein [Burkholderiaceae bacterium]
MTNSSTADIDPGRITFGQMERMTPDERAALERNPAYIKKQEENAAKFKAMHDEYAAATTSLQTQLQSFFKSFEDLFASIDIGVGIVDSDEAAALALIKHLDAALADPEIQPSVKVSRVISAVIERLGELDINSVKEDRNLEAAFAQPWLKKTNTVNGGAPKLKAERADAESMCKKWFADPGIYTNKAAFSRDVLEKELCKDKSTFDRWFAEFLRDLKPGTEWLNEFGSKYRKAALSR